MGQNTRSVPADLGAVEYNRHNAAGCADSQLTGNGVILVNFCTMSMSGGAWVKSEKYVIENAKLQRYEWTNSANKDCSGTGTASIVLNGLPVKLNGLLSSLRTRVQAMEQVHLHTLSLVQ